MQISITGRRIELSEKHKDYIHERISQLRKFFDNIMDVHVTLEKEKHREKAEVTIKVNGVTLHGEEETEDIYSSIDKVADKIERQIKKHKGRLKDRRQGKKNGIEDNSIRFKLDVLSGEDVDQGQGEPRIISTRTLDLKPLSVDEAVMQMDLLNQDFLVFRNMDSNNVNVIYRRGDGNYSLVEEV